MLSDVLKRLVATTGKSQKEIARDLGLIQQRFNFYVTGHREPDAEMLGTLADYFFVSVDYLLGREESKGTSTPASDDELIQLWASLAPHEALRVKDFVLEMIANRKEPPARSD